MRIGIIGAGWYGCHIALTLAKEGYEVELFEKNEDIFQGISGNFGIRLHKGPHYPRSDQTRKNCQEDFTEFYNTYPDLLIEHEYSIYALGKTDALSNPSKVDLEQFKRVCFESEECKEINLSDTAYGELDFAADIHEPSIMVGSILRQKFREKLKEYNIKIHFSYEIKDIKSSGLHSVLINATNEQISFDKVINTTSFQNLIPDRLLNDFPVSMEAVYQPCLGLLYEDTKPSDKPISFIIMDGWFPCLMPYVEEKPFQNKYIMTHGSYTIMGSFSKPEKAYSILNQLNDDFVTDQIKPKVEQEMLRFWPSFHQRFRYLSWKGTVLVKLKTKKEFRSAVSFEKDNVIYVVPGKVSNIFTSAREVIHLIQETSCIIEKNIKFIKNGVLDSSRVEIEEKPNPEEPSTCTLNTFYELKKNDVSNYQFFPSKTIYNSKSSMIKLHDLENPAVSII